MKHKYIIGLVGLVILVGLGWYIYREYYWVCCAIPEPDEIYVEDLPAGLSLSDDKRDVSSKSTMKSEKKVSTTKGQKHTVPLVEILSGGPPKDGIPPIDNPAFETVSQASKWVGDETPGISATIGGDARFYPFSVLVWHEIVNDTFNGQRVLISYCPLCFSGIVFDPVVQGERVEFGTSGKLWNSNLVMYDRKTESYWSQVLGEAIVGEEAGQKLEILPSDTMRYGKWKALNSDGKVLSRKTGFTRDYTSDPYGDYYTSKRVIFPLNAEDDSIHPKTFVFGILDGDKSKAYVLDSVKEKGEIEDVFAGKTIIAQYDESLDAVRLFEKTSSGDRIRINPFPNYWFSWKAAHPNTEIYQ